MAKCKDLKQSNRCYL